MEGRDWRCEVSITAKVNITHIGGERKYIDAPHIAERVFWEYYMGLFM